ncbi:MAG: hypothetical protein K2H00_05005 [Muribaculum intestinale]|nr:hypothetical protein [Muribaculum intestinale]
MKNNIFKGLLLGGVAVVLAGCSENSWNEKYLDGFEAPDLNAPARNYIDYTLTSSDYSRIAKMSANVEMAKAAGVEAQLAAVGTNGYFTDVITAKDYLGAWLDSVSNTVGSVFKSAVPTTTARISYETAADMPLPVVGINGAQNYVVTVGDYVKAYDPSAADAESANYAEAFSPMCPADKNIPNILAENFPNASNGDYVYVTYNQSATNPVWGGGETGGTTPKFELSDAIASIALNDAVDVNAYISGLCAQGMIITDKSGSCLAYTGKTFDATQWKVGQQLNVTGKGGAYNGGLQIGSPVYGEVEGVQAMNLQPEVLDGAKWDALYTVYADNKTAKTGALAKYVKITAKVVKDGNYWNMLIDGASAGATLYQATTNMTSVLVDGAQSTFEAWAISATYSSSLGINLINIVPVYIDGKAVADIADGAVAAKSVMMASRSVSNVAYETVNAVYSFNGSKWTVPSDVYVLTSSDYKQMGTTSLTTAQVKEFFPKLLAKEFPYAADGDVKYVVYGNNHKCEQLIYNGESWSINTMSSTVQFVRTTSKKWIYDPTIYLYFSTDYRTDMPSLAFYQACVRWVWDNINVAQLGIDNSLWDSWPVNEANDPAEKAGVAHIGYCWGSGKATQEGYSGASAYYCNYDSRPYTLSSYLKDDYQTYYGGLSDDEVIETVQKRFAEVVAPAAMGICYPDAKVGTGGVDQEYEVTLIQYNKGTASGSHEVVFRFKVVAPGKFQLVECESWGIKGE